MQYIIEHIHLWGGVPWWVSIVGTGLLIRLALLKPMISASDTSARLHNIKPLINPLREEMLKAAKVGNQMEVQLKRAEIGEIQRNNGIKLFRTMIPMIQIPLGFGMFRVVRGMTSLPMPALANETALWINDLTVADPMYILPAISAFCLYRTFKVCRFPIFFRWCGLLIMTITERR